MVANRGDALQSWLGHSETARDVVTDRLVLGLRATLESDRYFPKRQGQLPVALHWCLAPPIAPMSGLGPDGHPARGGFLPQIDDLPRRMWAGSTLEFLSPLTIGDTIERSSRIAEIDFKEGRTGPLCFVRVDHSIFTAKDVLIHEQQNIVYRQAASQNITAVPRSGTLSNAEFSLRLKVDPVLLFRYSALTFNGHRIHYDRPYATNVEHYEGLVVHAPLQATLLLEFAAEVSGTAPNHFEFRCVQPLFDGTEFSLKAQSAGQDLVLWIDNGHGETTMKARAAW